MAQSLLDSTRSRSSQSGKDAPVVPLVPPKRRRPTWVVAGGLLILTAAIVGAWIFSSTTSRLAIVVAARDLEPGDVLQASDLRVVEITTAPDMRAIQESQQSLVIGRVARGPIPAGTVVNTDLFADPGAAVPSGFVVVGASLEAGAAPLASLASGDPVDIVGVSKAAGADTSSATVLTRGTVWAVDAASGSSSSPKLWVSLLVPTEAQTAVAQAAADGRLRLSLVGVTE